MSDHSNFRISFREPECNGGLKIVSFKRHARVQTESSNFQDDRSNNGFFRNRSFLHPATPIKPKILFVEAGTSLPSSRCSPIKVESNLFSCVSSICTHPPGSQEGGGREGFNFNIDNTNLSFTDVVPRFFAAIKRNLLIPSAYY